jgi:hypothetical protein
MEEFFKQLLFVKQKTLKTGRSLKLLKDSVLKEPPPWVEEVKEDE